MAQKKIKGLLVGAMLGTMMGSASALLMKKMPKNQIKGWKESAQAAVDEMLHWNNNKNGENASFAKGALFGALIGASSALLLSPTTGKKLRENISQTYQDMTEKAQELLNHAEAPAKKAARNIRTAVKKATHATHPTPPSRSKRKAHHG